MKTAIITGAARGIGLAVAHTLASEGMRIVGIDTRGNELQRAISEVGTSAGVETLALEADVTNPDQVARVVSRSRERFERIDVLVSNAGIREPVPLWDSSIEQWDRTIDTNLKGPFLFAREVLSQGMLKHNRGRIIFVSSLAAKSPSARTPTYGASKSGLVALADSLSKGLKQTRINVTVVMPGRTATPMAYESEAWDPQLGWLDPQQVAQAILFCIKQQDDTIIPELMIHHRNEL